MDYRSTALCRGRVSNAPVTPRIPKNIEFVEIRLLELCRHE